MEPAAATSLPAASPVAHTRVPRLQASHILAGLSGLALLVSAFFTPGTLPVLPLCWFKAQTGWPCPGCGLTRAFCAISHGELDLAWQFNPFGFLFYGLAVIFVLWPLLVWRLPKLAAWNPFARRAGWFVIGLVAAMWAFGLWRIVTGAEL